MSRGGVLSGGIMSVSHIKLVKSNFQFLALEGAK